MPKTDWLVSKLTQDYPQFQFKKDTYDHWSPRDATIYFNSAQKHYEAFLLHELSHALLEHNHYKKDIELISIERNAWNMAATKLAPAYNLSINNALIQHSLDTYRDWIHAKSACPTCDQTGVQINSTTYQCLHCQKKWRTNPGIDTAIRRYSST